MQQAVPEGGMMAAILGLSTEVIEEICENTPGKVSIANYNCPGQIVITGEEQAVGAAMEKLKEAGAKRCLPLKVSGPFHSEMLAGAGEQLAGELENVMLHPMQLPYLANVTADYVSDISEVKGLLAKQVSSSVRWQQTIERMLADGVDTFIEIGPGKTLSGFMKKITKGSDIEYKVFNVEKWEDLDKVVEGVSAC
jgi:[acyl-carrier-protein] S-malonyltransferase